jgi:hypothetical protein
VRLPSSPDVSLDPGLLVNLTTQLHGYFAWLNLPAGSPMGAVLPLDEWCALEFVTSASPTGSVTG